MMGIEALPPTPYPLRVRMNEHVHSQDGAENVDGIVAVAHNEGQVSGF